MPQCAIVTCNNTHRRTKGGNVRYHRFPGDSNTRTRWLQVCGKTVPNYSTARVCSHHFSQVCYERDVQHELLGLPSRCRLKKGAVPDTNLPKETEELLPGSAIDILLAVGLVPSQPAQKTAGGVPRDLQKMRIMDDITEGCMVQPSSPGHAELRPENGTTEENGPSSDNQNDNSVDGCDQTETNKEESETKDSSAAEENHNETDLTECANNKRKEDEEETTGKKLKMDIDENFLQRNKMLNDCIEVMDCEESNGDQLQIQSEQLVSEIRALNELAREKEMEWNSILHLKKFKEELLMRIERKKQISIINSDKPEVEETQDESRIKTGQSIMRLNISKSPQTDRINKNILLKAYNSDMNGSLDLRQNVRNRPTLDVQAIIADYRQRHPENVPRRGKRIRNNYMGTRNSNILNFSSTALGSGSQMKQNNLQDISNELNLILGAMDSVETSKGTLEASQRIQESASFKNMLLQLSRLSQNEKNELLQNAMKPPPPYPEVTVHPVTSAAPLKNSLLHGILTKTPSRGNNKKNFSPTLARLLTAPDQSGDNTDSAPSITNNSNHPSNISISEMLSSSKARNEITITPVENQFDKLDGASKKVSNVEDDGTEDSDDRLVIDESKRDGRRETDNSSEAGDEVPECQGCNQKTAQFVCAGCGNQWYCSRDCQVSAWDEHSEVCCG